MSQQIFKVFANCFMTEGHGRALISDTQRGLYYTIPLSMYHLIEEKENSSIESIRAEFGNNTEEAEIIDEYFNFLIEHEIIFTCNAEWAALFPPVNAAFDYPGHISNAIIKADKVENTYFKLIFGQLVKLLCYNVEITITNSIDQDEFLQLLSLCNEYELDSVSLIVCTVSKFSVRNLIENFTFISSVVFYLSDKDEEEYNEQLSVKVAYTRKDLRSNLHCGMIGEKYFTPNISHYTESLAHNSCLNRKISIDVDGNIKNCPSMQESFGNIKETTLEEAVNKPGFKKYWNITKDQITKCKDCEFRHVCTDCRAYTENPDDIYSAPLKCGYDPYTCEWEEWSTNPLKQETIMYYGMKEIVKQ